MVRFLIIFFLSSCSSIEKNNLIFDSSFEGKDRFLFKRCLSNIGQDLEISGLKVINLANNINVYLRKVSLKYLIYLHWMK